MVKRIGKRQLIVYIELSFSDLSMFCPCSVPIHVIDEKKKIHALSLSQVCATSCFQFVLTQNSAFASRKHAYIILTPLNPTFI